MISMPLALNASQGALKAFTFSWIMVWLPAAPKPTVSISPTRATTKLQKLEEGSRGATPLRE